MKKSLFALAALGAFATAAQAQSSVTLFGTLDASVQYISNGGVDYGSTNTSTSKSTSTPDTASCPICMVDGAIATSQWGMKGTEDLGGGTKGIFYIAGDVLDNNGTMHSSGIFRRGAYVGLVSNLGELTLGVRSNPFVDTLAGVSAVGGNTVNQVRYVTASTQTDFIKNGISYATPTMSGFNARLAYGASNVDGAGSDGSILAVGANLALGGLGLSAGYNKFNHIQGVYGDPSLGTAYASTTSGNITALSPYANVSSSAANATLADSTGYVLGAKYNFASLGLPALTISYGFVHGEYTKFTSIATPAKTNVDAVASSGNLNAHMIGLGYQVTPNLLLGANYIPTTSDSSFYNLQARYSLSKRTSVYAQGSMAKNGAGADSIGGPIGNFMPVNVNSSTYQKNVGGYGLVGSGFTGGLPNTSSSAIGVGVIHNF